MAAAAQIHCKVGVIAYRSGKLRMRRSFCRVAILILLIGSGGVKLLDASGRGGQHAAMSSPKDTVNPADYVGQETCAPCHQDQVKGFPENPHSKLALEHGGKGVTCEGCHGPGKAHVDSGGGGTEMFSVTKTT